MNLAVAFLECDAKNTRPSEVPPRMMKRVLTTCRPPRMMKRVLTTCSIQLYRIRCKLYSHIAEGRHRRVHKCIHTYMHTYIHTYIHKIPNTIAPIAAQSSLYMQAFGVKSFR